jgi:hypothetical protein
MPPTTFISRPAAAIREPAAPSTFLSAAAISMGGRCRVFVSYSHRDETATRSVQGGGFPSAFWEYLKSLLPPLQGRGVQLAAEQVFFDQARLNTEPYWSAAIQRALDECEVFIFLVSVNSLNSAFCMHTELHHAARRGVPIVPILLVPKKDWRDHPIPGLKDRKLGDYHSAGLPKGPDFNPLAVSEWPNEAKAWDQVCSDLAAFLVVTLGGAQAQRRDEAPPPEPRPHEGHERPPEADSPVDVRKPPRKLLPFFCNQVPLVDRFKKDLVPWGQAVQDRALLVLAKGTYWDDIPTFVDRLRFGFLMPHPSAPMRKQDPSAILQWPEPGRSKGEELIASVVEVLYEGLGIYALHAHEDLPGPVGTIRLENALGKRDHVAYLRVELPSLSLREAGDTIRALLTFLERCARPGVLGHLDIVMSIEDEKLVACRSLKQRLGLEGFTKTHVIELEPIEDIEKSDVVNWHRVYAQQLEPLCPRPILLAHCFQTDTRRFRMREFYEQVKPLLRID